MSFCLSVLLFALLTHCVAKVKGGGKVVKGFGTFVLDFFTLGLSEIVADPVTKKQDMVVFEVFYDDNERVDKVKFIQLPK